MGGSPFWFHGGSLAVRYMPQLRTYPTSLCQWTHLQQISTQALAKNHHPSTTAHKQTSAQTFPHPQFPSFCKSQLTPPAHNLLISLPHRFYTPFLWQQRRIYLALLGNWTRTSMMGARCLNHHGIIQYGSQFWQFVCSCYHSPGVTLDIFPFPITAQDIFIRSTTPQCLAESIH